MEEILAIPIENDIARTFSFRFWGWCSLLFVIIIMGSFIDKKFILIKRRLDISDKIMNFLRSRCFTCVKFPLAVVLGFLFILAYFSVLTFFLQGWENINLITMLPELLIFSAGILFIYYSLKDCPKGACGFVFLGGVLICARRLFEIFFQRYQEFRMISLSWTAWSAILLLDFFGFLFLLFGFRRLNYVR